MYGIFVFYKDLSRNSTIMSVFKYIYLVTQFHKWKVSYKLNISDIANWAFNVNIGYGRRHERNCCFSYRKLFLKEKNTEKNCQIKLKDAAILKWSKLNTMKYK